MRACLVRVASPARLLVAGLLVASFTAASAFGPTFGVGYTPDQGFFCSGEGLDTVVLNHTVSAASSHGVLHHFWVTGPDVAIDRIWVSYYLDGELTPSIVFQPSMMCGVAFPNLLKGQLFDAGGLCGKNAAVGGFYNTFPIPFRHSVVVTIRPDDKDGKCNWGYLNLRGTEGLPLMIPKTAISLPVSARLVLQRNDWQLHQPLEYINVSRLQRGQHGVVFMTSFGVQAKPVGGTSAGGGYIEGCWQLYVSWETPFPGVVVGTGFEDYFDSSYYFGVDTYENKAKLFATPLAGLTIFDRSTDGHESLSAYRFHTGDPLVFTDGGRLVWRVGGESTDKRTKCGNRKSSSTLSSANWAMTGSQPFVGRELSAVNVTTYSWVFTWTESPEDKFLV